MQVCNTAVAALLCVLLATVLKSLSVKSVKLYMSPAFPVADFNSPGAVERRRVAVWIAGAKDGSPGTSNISAT